MIDEEPTEARLELVAVDDRARVPVRHVKKAAVATAVVVAALVGINLLPASEGVEGTGDTGPAAPPSAGPSPRSPSSPAVAATKEYPLPHRGEIVPGRYVIGWPRRGVQVHLTMPAGWWADHWGGGAVISKGDPSGERAADVTLAIRDVARIVTDACATTAPFLDVGPTAGDLAAALSTMGGMQRPTPTDVTLGGYPATRFELTLPDSCPGPDRRPILESATGPELPGFAKGGTATIDVVDVSGDRVVIIAQRRGASAEELDQLAAIVGSIEIEVGRSATPAVPQPLPAGELAIGEHRLKVDGVQVAFTVPTSGWIGRGAARNGGWLYKGTPGAPDAVEIAIWSPDNVFADPCAGVPLTPPVGPSAADLAAAVAGLPGTDSPGPVDVTVGGVAAKGVVLTIDVDVGCDPRSFRLWYEKLGDTRSPSALGSTIRAWIVDGSGGASSALGFRGEARILIEAETSSGAGPELEGEIAQILDSISFCCG